MKRSVFSVVLLVLFFLLNACGGSGSKSVDRGDADFVVGEVTGSTVRLGSIAEFDVQLATRPTANVQLPLSSSDRSEAIVGTNDAIANGQQNYSVRLGKAVSSDEQYDGLDPEDVAISGLLLEFKGFAGSRFTRKVSPTGQLQW